MRTVTATTAQTWQSGDYVGDAGRAMVRATIAHLQNLLVPYGSSGGVYSSVVFGQHDRPVELPNIKSVQWKRAIDSDTATLTMVLYNQAPLPIGEAPEQSGDFERAGWYTPTRGTGQSPTRWGYATNDWQARIVPDAIIKTYEGYGFDKTVAPEDDPNLYLSGVWRVDDVDFKTDQTITITARDIGSVLIDQILFPPIVPKAIYPLRYTAYHQVANPQVPSGSVSWQNPVYSTDSGVPYVGVGGTVYGHHGSDAFDNDDQTYWLSIGNARPDQGYSYEYVEGSLNNVTCGGIKVKVWGGPYTMYVSVKSGGVWQGVQKIPYDPNNPVSAPNGADIMFVSMTTIDFEQELTINFTTPYSNVTAVRVTFTDLYNSRVGTYPYRAGVRHFQASVGAITMVDGGTHTEGNYGDYTDIVKQLLAWGGFYWPNDSQLSIQTESDGDVDVTLPASDDTFIGKGRVWGDFLESGTYAAAVDPNNPNVTNPLTLGIEIWDKKPILDGINYIRDLLGFIFFIDDTGAAVWRLPNIYSLGNWIGDGASNASRTTTIQDIDEQQVLIELNAKLSGRTTREAVFVGNLTGKYGAISTGFLAPTQQPTGLRRVAGWTDQNFGSDDECQIMSDLIALRMYFQYRTDQLTISGYPGIQIDDQVRIWERTSNETFVHYVKSIDMSWDLETGKYTYTLGTYWLGASAFDDWAFKPSDFSQPTQNYLHSLGAF